MTNTLSINNSSQTGIIHSVESCGTVDGPGIRFVIFTQGCPLRCLYCHNPDCRHFEDGKIVTVDELITEIDKYRAYFESSGGGVTITGGEPLMQPDFVKAIFQNCKKINIHTTLDTSGYVNLNIAKPILEYTDLVLLDIKSFDPNIYHKLTSVSLEPTLIFARYLAQINKPTWIRFVLVPNLTDPENNVRGLAQFIAPFKNIEKVEILPFHKMGEYKWEQLGYDYQLKDTQPPSPQLMNQVINIFKSYGLKVQ
ncbi:pyruvate formate-lyase activating enzyme [Geminocystis sp. NIES-3708]|uniref:pyruvate formate-lyase-activating protein n=1 Tax=Geminocystis sp. NIES-3708 TaxID=1615909 RepID=UPI0005FC91FE|nr:pyruvate formate-lyase-activating protein [Geminocystis sp. NIES-3708]BAQ62240.1 pyruvate formate-lyase activating enzyme [Geminocystis sp. NIES-3708]